jgi:RNA-binding protein
MTLTGKQRRHLRSLGHHLDPVVQLGKLGLTEAAIAAVDAALTEHELIKVRLGTECPDDRNDVADRLAPAVKGQVAQVLGRTLLVYRRHPKEPKIQLPRAESAG